jgi:Carboxypeptidase regulatory-like domain
MNDSIRRLLVTLVACSLAAVSHAAMVRVPVSLRGGLPPDKKFLPATCVLTPVGDHDASLQKMSVPLQVPGLGGFDMPAGTWMIEVVVAGYWHPPSVVHLKDRAETVEFKLWPTATIHGTIKVKKSDPMPQELAVRLQSPPSVGIEDRLPVTQIKCPVQDGAWSCDVPAGVLDLRFHARRFLSEYRWKFPLAAGANADLGTFVLRRGSSVIGNVELAPRLKPLDKETRILLHPRSFGAPADDRGRESMRVLAATTNDRGFFAIEGVPPGEYTIVAQQKDLTSLPQPVRVLEDAEVELFEPLILYPPRTLTLHVMPEVDPAGNPWHIRLYAEAGPGGRVDVIAEDSLSREGTWRQEGLHASRYTVALRTSSGAKWLNESVDLSDESNVINLQIPLVKVRGTVKLGERPVAARIYFGGESGSTSIPLESDDKGVFTGVLPKRDDPWNEVTVVATLPAVRRTLRNIKVAPAGSGEANVDLILPSTYIAGNVVDADGRPVQHAIINVQNTAHEPFVQIFAENDGSFDINGLAAGAMTLQASAYLQESNALDVTLTEGETTRVKLILKSTGILAGRVLSVIGPVAGARVIAMPTDVTSLATVPVTTNANGEFACPMAAGTRQVDFTVEAPGFAYKMFHLMVTDKGIDVPLDQAGGTLVVDAPPFDGADASTLPFLIHAGARRALPYIGRPAFEKTDRGYRIRVALLERGEYQVCIGMTQRCANGFLPPLGELSLVVPLN